MVLQNYSWPDFLLAALLLSLVWYLAVGLLYFRRKPGVAGSVPLAHGWEKGVDVLDDGLSGASLAEVGADFLVGASVPDVGVSVVSAEEVGFAGGFKQVQLGLLPDVQKEISTLCLELESNLGGKEDFAERFAQIRAVYQIPASAQAALNGFIREHVPFYIPAQELEDLWV